MKPASIVVPDSIFDGTLGRYHGFSVYEGMCMTKSTNEKQPAAGRSAGLMEDRSFRKKVAKRRAANKAARKARR